MPWKIVKDNRCSKSKPYAVIKESDNSVAGCHETRKKANAQLAALNMQEKDSMENIEEVQENKESNEKYGFESHEPVRHTPFTSFEEMEEAEEAGEKAHEIGKLADCLSPMVKNVIVMEEDVESGINKVFNGFKTRISNLISKMTNSDEEHETEENIEEYKQHNSFMVFKGDDGKMLWLSSYSNNIRDNDHPPEIIASESHENFVKMVDEGKIPLPKLWLWHCKELVIGEATSVAYDKESGFAIAAGFFYKEAEPIAQAIRDSDTVWGVSHGMPGRYIMRSKDDPTVITRHVTQEISPLPLWAAANKFAGFSILKEVDDMTISESKKAELISSGIPEDALNTLQATMQKASEVADELELERKETSEEPEVLPVEEEVLEETKEESDTDEVVEPAFSSKQVEELKATFEVFGETFVKSILDAVDEKLAPIVEKLDEKEKTQEEMVKETIANTPAASLSDMIFAGYQLKAQSATESDATKVDGRTKLGKSGPAEVGHEPVIEASNPLLADVVKSVVTGGHLKVMDK